MKALLRDGWGGLGGTEEAGPRPRSGTRPSTGTETELLWPSAEQPIDYQELNAVGSNRNSLEAGVEPRGFTACSPRSQSGTHFQFRSTLCVPEYNPQDPK